MLLDLSMLVGRRKKTKDDLSIAPFRQKEVPAAPTGTRRFIA